ncbi:MAG: LysR family transcriptional regulator [Burkholderiaceae bacterium]
MTERKIRTPNLRQFEQFVAVAEEMSFRRAAQRLNMAQPPLTASIKALEEQLGEKLINRDRRVVDLTKAGQMLLREAKTTLAQAERAVWMIRNRKFESEAELRVSFVGLGGAFTFIPKAIKRFRSRHPEVKLILNRGTSGQQLEWLAEKVVDIAILIGPIAFDPRFSVRCIFEREMLLTVPIDHRLAHADREAGLIDLAHERWIMFPPSEGPGIYGTLKKSFDEAGIDPPISHYVGDFDTLLGFIEIGLGVSLAPVIDEGQKQHDVTFLPLAGNGSPVYYRAEILNLASTPSDALISDFVQTVLQAYEMHEPGTGGKRFSPSMNHSL